MKAPGTCQEDPTVGYVKDEEQDVAFRIVILSDLLNFCVELLSLSCFDHYGTQTVAQQLSGGMCLVSRGPTYNLY
jgi:hypothetical protein